MSVRCRFDFHCQTGWNCDVHLNRIKKVFADILYLSIECFSITVCMSLNKNLRLVVTFCDAQTLFSNIVNHFHISILLKLCHISIFSFVWNINIDDQASNKDDIWSIKYSWSIILLESTRTSYLCLCAL